MSFTSTTSLPGIAGLCSKLGEFPARQKKKLCFDGGRAPLRCVRASAERSGEGVDGRIEREESRRGGTFTGPAMEVTTFDQRFGEAEFPVWEKIGAVVRLSYGIGQFHSIHLFVPLCSRFLHVHYISEIVNATK